MTEGLSLSLLGCSGSSLSLTPASGDLHRSVLGSLPRCVLTHVLFMVTPRGCRSSVEFGGLCRAGVKGLRWGCWRGLGQNLVRICVFLLLVP